MKKENGINEYIGFIWGIILIGIAIPYFYLYPTQRYDLTLKHLLAFNCIFFGLMYIFQSKLLNKLFKTQYKKGYIESQRGKK